MARPLLLLLVLSVPLSPSGQAGEPGVPGFHHLHLNSIDLEAAIGFYTRLFPIAVKTMFAGETALRTGQVYVLFTKVSSPPRTEPQTAINAAPRPGTVTRAETDCKAPGGEPSWPALEKEGTIRDPAGGALFDDVAVNWYANQGTQPLAPTRGRLYDHFGLSVRNLDVWMAKLRHDGVTILASPNTIGGMRAVMIEGPSREAIELLEVRP